MKLFSADPAAGFRRAAAFVALANLGYFGIEFGVATAIGSVSLFADSIDFLEDTAVNTLIVIASTWSARWRGRVGMALSGVLLVPSLATLWMAWLKLAHGGVPAPVPLSLTGFGALAVNLTCAFVLARHRHHHGSLSKAAFLSARNDTVANVSIIVAGLTTAYLHSVWPDLIVGLGIAALNAGAAREVWEAAKKDSAAQQRPPAGTESAPLN